MSNENIYRLSNTMHKKIFSVCYFVIYLLILQDWSNFDYFKDTRSIPSIALFSGVKG